MIKVIIVDDLKTVRELIKVVIEKDPEIKVVGMANGGKSAIDIIPQLKPDIVLMDLRMPDMDGFQTVRHLMGICPTRILIVTASYTPKSDLVFKALEAGALDLINKPPVYKIASDPNIGKILIEKIKILSKAKITTGIESSIMRLQNFKFGMKQSGACNRVVAIAASTGGPNLPAGVVIVQHMSKGFIQGLADWLQSMSKIKIRVAQEGDMIKPGEVLFTPDTCHMIINNKGQIQYEDSPPVGGVKPSADIVLPSIAKYFGKNAIGVIMTGMGDDGARGIECIKKEGGKTIAQNEETCAVFGMPKVAIERGVIDEIVPLDKIAETIIKYL
ncbi:chemotaxis-specific protein-glutamate methyltransferase CheB [Candidatus Desantisbacteria bacterium]|nr:chemotaxis-specific protein-glutamate methyltransferase CheB [Candidatus Desantisbacteria bacterium]